MCFWLALYTCIVLYQSAKIGYNLQPLLQLENVHIALPLLLLKHYPK